MPSVHNLSKTLQTLQTGFCGFEASNLNMLQSVDPVGPSVAGVWYDVHSDPASWREGPDKI